MDFMTNEESYTQRRMLFKDIWETAMNIDEKEDIMNKPKVIKTLRLDEVDKCVVGKSKKQRIKNLRHVCNRILDFCDRQDADDVFYEQFAADGQLPVKAMHKIDIKHMKKKTHRVKKKMKKAKSSLVHQQEGQHVKTTLSERKAIKVKPFRVHSPIRKNRKNVVKSRSKAVKQKPSPLKEEQATATVLEERSASNASNDSRPSVSHRKPVKKKHSRKKKLSDADVQTIGMMKINNGQIPRVSPKAGSISKPLPHLAKVMIN